MPEFLSLYHWAVLLILLMGLLTVVVNLILFEGLKEERPGTEMPLVSILIPARNEERSIGPCVKSLLAQDYPFFELIVLDDHSEDDTALIARGMGVSETGSIARLIRGQPLPPGWTGKAWACHQLAAEARGVYLFFTDADTEHERGLLSALVGYAQRRNADLVSAWPRLVTVTLGEKLVVPMILVLGMTLYPHWLTLLLQRHPRLAGWLPRRHRRMLGVANGQSIFFRRAAYDLIGGHETVRGHMVEDVALGRAVAARMHEGLRVFNCDALRFSRCRMYQSLGEVWEGFTKNLRAAFEDSLPGFLIVGTVHACCYLLPFVWVFFPGPFLGLILLQILVIYTIRLLLAWRFRTSWLGALLHPLSQILATLIALNSWRCTITGTLRWKGRTYQGSQA